MAQVSNETQKATLAEPAEKHTLSQAASEYQKQLEFERKQESMKAKSLFMQMKNNWGFHSKN